MKVYLAQKFRGDPHCLERGQKAAHDLRAEGYEVVSPAEHELSLHRDPTDPNLPMAAHKDGFLWDMEQVLGCDAVVVMPGYEGSRGVAAEIALADAVDIPVLSYPSLVPFSVACSTMQALSPTGEHRVVDEATGGAKGQKDARLGGIDPLALEQLALVSGMGEVKYGRFNYAKGFKWSLAVDALYRHLLAFLGGEDLDPESGLPHTAHVAWQALCLTTFLQRKLGTDDRFPT